MLSASVDSLTLSISHVFPFPRLTALARHPGTPRTWVSHLGLDLGPEAPPYHALLGRCLHCSSVAFGSTPPDAVSGVAFCSSCLWSSFSFFNGCMLNFIKCFVSVEMIVFSLFC